ncbi:MAG: site-specific DNA-methyltransferase [Proteobacteria bacterium]|nr:site-specific DNA-methyltransferase [Pseudomonadota bacterium]
MSRLTDLIADVKAISEKLGKDLEYEFKHLSKRVSFGLNFERHIPENVDLYKREIRVGDKVRILPPRGSTENADTSLYGVEDLQGKTTTLVPLKPKGETKKQVAIDNLVVVAEFHDPIYPGLEPSEKGKIENGGDKPFHIVITGENYHALETLHFTHRGKVDVIYIDPPYNTRDKDWKYNNDYVDSDDAYRHSKWLAMMERRLKLARNLLNLENSVIIVTIDENEYLRLGLLLEQIFPHVNIQMVTSVIKPEGTARKSSFYRTDEYIFVVMLGEAKVLPEPMSEDADMGARKAAIWSALLRHGSNKYRTDRPNMFYPIWVTDEGKLHSVGNSLKPDEKREDVSPPSPDVIAVWPVRSDGNEGNWQLGPDTLRQEIENGTAKVTQKRGGGILMQYVPRGEKKRIETGEIDCLGKDESGALILKHSENVMRRVMPRTVWNSPPHYAGVYGTKMLQLIVPNRDFDFPKSLYAVEDILRFFVADKPEAVILDFFAGSGTTAHAVMRLNKQDGGKRQCILVTNNEVSFGEQKDLQANALRPGDADWEKWGICDYITKPRIKSSITGKTPEGKLSIKGDYKFLDEFPMEDGFEENAEFFTLTYESNIAIGHNKAFHRLAPLLWMRAGSQGRRIDEIPKKGWDIADTYAVLANPDCMADFLVEMSKAKSPIRLAYIITDEDTIFQSFAQSLPRGVEAVRLYEAYLSTFEFLAGREE